MVFKIRLLLIACLFALFSPLPVLAIEYGGIGGRPAFPDPSNSRSESIFIHNISPNQIINEGIKVINNTKEKKALLVYSADSIKSTDGGFACKQFVEPKENVGKWIKLEESEVTLEANSSEVVDFTINIPGNIEYGEYNGCVLIQEKKESSNQAGINLSFRTGIRVVLTQQGEIRKILRIEDFQVLRRENRIFILRPTIANSGNVSVDANVKVPVKDIFGRKIKEFDGDYSVLRGDKSIYNLEFKPPAWGGRFTAQTFVKYNDGTKDVQLESRKITFFCFPTKQVLLFTALAFLPILLLIIFLLRRYWVLRKKRREWVDYQIQPGDSIESIASRSGVSWKLMARVNKLKPPYALKVGQTIKIPPTI